MMTEQDLQATVNDTIRDVLDLDDDVAIGPATTAKDVAGWDSLQHVRIMLSLERRFKFRWDESEIAALKNVGDIYAAVARNIPA